MRILPWLAGGLGLAGLAKALRRRPEPLTDSGPDPRADELRRRLEQPAEAEPEPAVEEPAAPRTREDVHAKARAAIAEMNASGADDGGDAGGEPARDA